MKKQNLSDTVCSTTEFVAEPNVHRYELISKIPIIAIIAVRDKSAILILISFQVYMLKLFTSNKNFFSIYPH